MIKAFIFDLFETLITEKISKLTGAEIASSLDIPIKRYKEILSGIRIQRYRGEYPDFRDVLKYVAENVGKECDMKLFDEIARKRGACKAMCYNNISDEIKNILTELKKRNKKLALISNASCEEIKTFDDCRLAHFFDEIVFSCRVGYVKPEIEINKVTCDKLRLNPDECVYIGDGGSGELVGAKSAGMHAYCAAWFISKYGCISIEGYPILWKPKDILFL